jgi:hypothetical protein
MLKYWDNIPFVSSYNPENKYVLFDWYSAGFNNIRMSFEIACVLAYTLNRTLIIPKSKNIYLLKKDKLSVTSFFDMEDNIIEWNEEYEEVLHTEKNIETFTSISHETLYKLEDYPVPNYFKGSTIINLQQYYNTKVLHFPKNLFGNFYHAVHSNNIQHLCQYIGKHVHYKKEIFEEAKKCIDILGDQKYYAIHVRRGDFMVGGQDSWMHNFIVMSAEKIIENIEYTIPKYSKLYISTDEVDKNYFNPFKKYYDIYFYEDVKQEEIPSHNIGMIEQIICARSKTFVGTFVSTFTSYINRLRGYMRDIEDKRVLTFSKKYDENFVDAEIFDGLFSREYSIGWKIYE